jgi:hypothetical protein
MTMSLVMLSVADLGFPEGATTIQIIGSAFDTDQDGDLAPFTKGRGTEFNLGLCPPEVGPELRLQFSDQSAGERVHVAMKPIFSSDGEPRIFVLAHEARGLSLDAARARPQDRWKPEDKFIFCRGLDSAGQLSDASEGTGDKTTDRGR